MATGIDLSRTDLNLLMLFDVVFEERHVGRAAARLNLSPSAVSHGLRRLRRLLHDPLFLRHPKGVAPTERAEAVAGDVAEILGRVRGVLAAAAPFDPSRSDRRFTIGTTDGIAALVLPGLLAAVERMAPGVDLRVRQMLPAEAVAMLDAREADLALVPALGPLPARFTTRDLYEEEFVAAMRAGHPLGTTPSLEEYRSARHVVFSPAGDARGFVDLALEEHGLARRVALTVPGFLLALAVVAETDLIAAMPGRQVRAHGPRFGVVAAELPLRLGHLRVRTVTPVAAAGDGGLTWILDVLATVVARDSAAGSLPAHAVPGRRGGRAASKSARALAPG